MNNKIDFKNEQLFASLEESAINGELNFNDFPPCEYKYFSLLARLGYMNRYKGWSGEICQQKQENFYDQYLVEKADFEKYFTMACKMQDNIRKSEMEIIQLDKAKNQDEKYQHALKALSLLVNDNWLYRRNGGNSND